MIATLSGTIAEKLPDIVILDVGGVGYGLLMATEDYGAVVQGQQVKVYVYEHIREAAHDLFGFTSRDTKQLFEQLLDVNGIGPKMALSVLNIGTPEAVRAAIAKGDTKFIQHANGVGKRVAERIVVELKDKVGLSGVDLAMTDILHAQASVAYDEAAEALISLGFTPQDALQALEHVDGSLPTAERVRLALRARR